MKAPLDDKPREELFYVVHALDDVRETKLFVPRTAGRMRMGRSARWSLMTLRSYLFLMMVLVTYRVLQLAGAFK